jgi:hypothetical protein
VPLEIAQARQRLDEQKMALARRHRADREQTKRTFDRRAGNALGLVGARCGNRDAMRRNAGGDQRIRGVRAGADHTSQQGPESGLDRRVTTRFTRT